MPGVPPPLESELAALAREIAELSDSDPALCLARARVALSAAERAGQHRLVARILCDRGFAANQVSQARQARSDYERALEIARELEDSEIEALARNGLGGAAHNLGEYGRALGHFEAALSIRRERGDRAGVIACLNNIALCHTALLQFDQAESLYHEGLALARRQGARPVEFTLMLNLVSLHLLHADLLQDAGQATVGDLVSAAYDAAAAALTQAEESDSELWRLSARGQLANVLVAAGEDRAALDLARHVFDHAARLGVIEAQIEARLVKGRCLMHGADTAAAIRELEAAVAQAQQFRHGPQLRSALRLLADAQAAAGEPGAALATFRRYHQITLAQRDRVAEQRAEALAARLQLERSRHEAEIARLRTRELESANQALMTQVMQDALTGLPNRRQLEAELAERLARGERLAFAMADVDHFKAINDCHSHPVGDAVLREIGELLRQHCRDEDLAARVGGEEFALLLADVDGAAAHAICERLRAAIARHDWPRLSPGLRVTMSFGLTTSRDAGDGSTSLQARADAALYRAKGAGRNRVITAG